MVDRRNLPKNENDEKKRGIFSGLNVNDLTKSFARVFQGRDNGQTKAKQQTLALAKQIQLTQNIISKQSDKLDELAKTDVAVADFVDEFGKIRFERIQGIIDKIESGEAVSAKEGKEVLETLDKIESNFEKLDFESLELSAAEMIDFAKSSISNDKLAKVFRRNLLSDLSNFFNEQLALSESEQEDLKILRSLQEDGEKLREDEMALLNKLMEKEDQLKVLEELKDLQKKGIEFTEEEKEKVDSLLTKLEGSDIQEIKSAGTLNDINSKMGSFLANQDDIHKALTKEDGDFESLREMLEKGFESDTARGLLDTVFAMLGLPGFASALSSTKGLFLTAGSLILSSATKLLGKGGHLSKFLGIFGKTGKFIGKLFSPLARLGKLMGPIAKAAGKGAKLIPGVGQAIAVIISLISGITGFLDAADISGKSEELLTLGDKFQAAFSNILSSLSFGFIDAKTIFNKIESFKTILKDFDVESMFTGIVDTVKSFFTGVVDKIKNFFNNFKLPSIGDLFNSDTSSIFSSDDKEPDGGRGNFIKSVKSFFSKSENESSDTIKPVRRDISRTNDVTPNDIERSMNKGKESSPINIVAAPSSQSQGPSPGPKARESIDDMRLSMLNLGIMD